MEATAREVRERLHRTYQTKDSRIQTPGKFEGQMIYVPYYWEQSLEFPPDYVGRGSLGFKITEDEHTAFPELKGRRTVWIRELSDGSVMED